MKLAIIGSGYVGLVTGACLSDFGHDVTCIDKDHKKISALKRGIIPIYEPGLESLVLKNIKSQRLSFTTNIKTAVKKCDVVFIAVGTPANENGGGADLNSVFAVISDLMKHLETEKTIVLKSTVPVGTNSKIRSMIKSHKREMLEVVSNPEFLREGSAIEDFMKPDRVIIGTNSLKAKGVMQEVYKPLYLRDFPIVFTDPESAEIIKYASNAFLATKVTFINEIAYLCEKSGGDIKEVAKGVGLDGRIGNKFLHAGPGYGGSCFPKDTYALTKTGDFYGAPQQIVETVIRVNDQIKLRMFDKIVKAADDCLSKKTICVLGLTFKPNTDDMRDAPSLTIIPKLIDNHAIVRAVDPKGKEQGKILLGDKVIWFDNPYEAATDADLLVILTEWNEFRALDLKKLKEKMKTATLVDLRNIYSEKEVLGAGFKQYHAVGR